MIKRGLTAPYLAILAGILAGCGTQLFPQADSKLKQDFPSAEAAVTKDEAQAKSTPSTDQFTLDNLLIDITTQYVTICEYKADKRYVTNQDIYGTLFVLGIVGSVTGGTLTAVGVASGVASGLSTGVSAITSVGSYYKQNEPNGWMNGAQNAMYEEYNTLQFGAATDNAGNSKYETLQPDKVATSDAQFSAACDNYLSGSTSSQTQQSAKPPSSPSPTPSGAPKEGAASASP